MHGRIGCTTGKLLVGIMAAMAMFVGNGVLPAAAELSSVDAVVQTAAPAIDQYWRGLLVDDYASPELYYYNTPDQPGNIETGCGESMTDNAFYCPPDGSIYLDYGFLQDAIDDEGDFTAVLILAHEWGHRIEDLIGIRPTQDGVIDQPGEVLRIEDELIADCFAGTVTNYFDELGMLERGDLGEGYRFVVTVLGDVPGSDSQATDAHGTAEQRFDVFMAGFASGDPSQCSDIVGNVLP